MLSSFDFYPWQTAVAQQLLSDPEHLSHAYLLYGEEGVGKRDFTHRMAAHLFCENRQGFTPCLNCVACDWMRQGQHPDYLKIRPDALAVEENDPTIATDEESKKSPSKEIVVDQIRLIDHWLHTGATRARWKIIVIYPIERMNPIAANALLKILEEPPPQTIFLLVSHQLPRILPTIRSRCRLQAMPIPQTALAQSWLEQQSVSNAQALLAFCGGAPLQALAMSKATEADSLYPCVQALLQQWSQKQRVSKEPLYAIAEKNGMLVLIRQLQKIHTDLMCVGSGLHPYYFPQWHKELQQMAQRVPLDACAELGQYYAQQVRVANHPLSARLFVDTLVARLESLLI